MNNVEQAQVALENLNKEKAIFFKEVEELCKNDEAMDVLKNIQNKLVRGEKTFTETEVKTFGAFLFVLGYDYLLQTEYEEKHIVDNVISRLSNIGLTKDSPEIKKLLEICNFISENKTDFIYSEFSRIYEENENKLDSNQFIIDLIGQEGADELKKTIELIVNHSVAPIKYYNVLDSIKENGFTITNFTQICRYISEVAELEASQGLVDLYSNNKFQMVTMSARSVIDNCKLLLIFCEVAGMLESTERKFKFELEGEAVDTAESESEENSEPTETDDEELSETDKENVIYNEKNNPRKFIYGLFFKDEMNDFKTFDEIIYPNLEENLEYLQYIYQYITKNIDAEEKDELVLSENQKNNLIKFNQELLEGTETTKAEYKRISELICADIPKETLDLVVQYVNDVIGNLILSTPQQKQYLLSQLLENGISTYNHLMQVLSIIETCKIENIACAGYYKTLVDFLSENESIKEIYTESKKLDNLTSKIIFYQKLHEFLTKLI